MLQGRVGRAVCHGATERGMVVTLGDVLFETDTAVLGADGLRNVDRARIDTRAYGEAHPVAGNDSTSGRQMNRRVEIVLSDAAGAVMAR